MYLFIQIMQISSFRGIFCKNALSLGPPVVVGSKTNCRHLDVICMWGIITSGDHMHRRQNQIVLLWQWRDMLITRLPYLLVSWQICKSSKIVLVYVYTNHKSLTLIDTGKHFITYIKVAAQSSHRHITVWQNTITEQRLELEGQLLSEIGYLGN